MKIRFCLKSLVNNYRSGRKLCLCVFGLLSLVVTNTVSALGLGEMTLKSKLNQPLDAEIKLLEVRDLSAAEILVGLASADAFERQGIERNFFLTSFRYQVVLEGAGAPYVRLTTDRAVREPFLNFIVEAQWPSGKLLREYTVLLDLPVFSDQPAAPVNPVQTETVNQQQIIRNQNERQTSTASRSTDTTQYNPRSSFEGGRQNQGSAANGGGPPTVAQPSYSGSEYSVQTSDTLWEIALAVRPSREVSVHQTMIALHRENPEAFISGNINLLKSGQVLRVPDLDQIQSLNRQQAVREVASHNAEWTGGELAPLDASKASYDSQTAEDYGEGRLSLASPDDSFDVSEGRVSGSADTGSGEAEALAEELTATQETLDKARSENRELNSKVRSLEEQIDTLESMLTVSNESLRALELAAADQSADEIEEVVEDTADLVDQTLEAGIGESSDESVVADASDNLTDEVANLYGDEPALSEEESSSDDNLAQDVSADVDDSAAEEATTAEPEVTEIAQQAQDEAKPVEKPKVVPLPKQKPSQPSIVDMLLEYLPFIGLGVVVLLGGIFFFFKKRNASDDDDDFDAFFSSDLESVEEEEDFNPIDLGQTDEFVEDALPETPEEELEQAPLEEESPEPETEDVVAESDIYIAYGKYDQAEEMLLSAISDNPNHHDARLKLLEVYAAQGNLDNFDPQYATLRTNGASDSLISRAASLRESFADAGDFDESSYDTASFDTDDGANNSFDLELDSSSDTEESSLDLDLGDDSVGSELDELSLDLDLEGDSDESSLEEDIEFDIEGLELGADETDIDDELKINVGSDEVDDLDIEPAAGIDLAADFDDDINLDTQTDASIESASDDLEFDLEGLSDLGDDELDLELDLGVDSGKSDIESALDTEEPEIDDLDLDLGDLELGLSDSTENDDIDLERDLDGDLDDLLPSSDESSSDSTLVREAQDLGEDDVLEPAPTQFDMAALDEELDALTSGLDNELDIEAELDLDTTSDSGITSIEDELEADLASLTDLDDSDAQAELDETIAKGEDMLAELDVDDLDSFAELSETSSETPTPTAAASMIEPETDFDEPTKVAASESKASSLDFDLPEIDPDATDDGDLDFLSQSDETATKLDLASAYVDMGDMAGAKEIIDEVLKEGSDVQQAEAKSLLEKIGS